MQTICSLFKPKLIISVSPLQQLLLKRLCIGCMILTAFIAFAVSIRDTSLDKSTAYLQAQHFVAGRLLRPSTAQFPPRSTNGVTVEYLGRHRYSITGHLHSLNTLGNLQKSDYMSVVRYIGAGEWVCEKLVFE
jgi:hypothetical protein